MGAEFLAMILVVVYVGAVAVLFLFVVMMLDVDFVKLREGMAQYLPVGGIIGLIVLAELVLVLGTWNMAPEALKTVSGNAGRHHQHRSAWAKCSTPNISTSSRQRA